MRICDAQNLICDHHNLINVPPAGAVGVALAMAAQLLESMKFENIQNRRDANIRCEAHTRNHRPHTLNPTH